MIAKRGALLLGILIMAFVAVGLAAELLTGTNVSSVIGGVYSSNEQTTQAPVEANPETCECSYNYDYETNTCNNDCGDLSGAACDTTDDCLV